MATMASKKRSTCLDESPASSRCSDRRQTASYSMAGGTLSSSVACPFRTARRMAADAPVGLRIAATTASVSITILTSPTIPHRGRCYQHRTASVSEWTPSLTLGAGLETRCRRGRLPHDRIGLAPMDSRRKFIGKMATGLAGTLAPASVLGANDRIRLGIVGAGDRGIQPPRWALACPNPGIAAFADVYTRRLEEAKAVAPAAAAYRDYRRLLEDPSIDAVVIATPPHLHAEHFTASLDAGRHVYQEKTLAFTVEHARRMRAAREKAPRCTVQIGHQACSSGQVADALTFLREGRGGKITAIRAHMFRNAPLAKPHGTRPLYPDMTPENIDWGAFLGESPRIPFDAP